MNKLIILLAGLSASAAVNAAIIANTELITDGSFEAVTVNGGGAPGSSFAWDFDNWFEANEDNNQSGSDSANEAGETDGTNAPAPTDGFYWGNVKSLNSLTGGVYQSLGTWNTGNVLTLDLDMNIGSRPENGNSARLYGGFVVEIYTGTTFTGADGSSISELTLLDTTGYETVTTLGQTEGEEWTADYTDSFDLTGINDGDEIWFSISVIQNSNDYGSETNVAGQSLFDEISVIAVPEPSAYALLSGFLALCAIMLRRRVS